MTLKFNSIEDIQTYTPQEAADMLVDCGYLELDEDERITDVRLECGCDLEIDINDERTETFTTPDLADAFTVADFITWAKDENDNDVLVCI